MKRKSIILISFLCALTGMLLYAFTKGWIIIHAPSADNFASLDYQSNQAIGKKKITLWFWKDDKWHNETTELVWSDDKADTLYYLIASWLKLLDEDDMMHKKISVQSVLLSPSGSDAYVSFDRYPFDSQVTIATKLMWLEGLLKTIRENKIAIQGIRFLIYHKTLQDPHLDFSKEWPVTGFSEQ
ncbi:MAG: hypothetical protein P4L31_00215 [Candidatus Babeliales bacterium]|nr:hypothetical protein [Candidatus Babeliales bacterium]